MSDERGTHTNGARFLVTRVFGLLAAAAAAEHGLGEALQGSRAAAGPFIQSWPDAALFRIEGGEPALTLLPNLLASGVLTLVGGGFGPPILGLAVAAAASAPEPGHPRGLGPLLAKAFPWILAAAMIAWLALVPGLPLLDLVFGIGDAALIPVIFAAFVLFPLCVLASRAADAVPSRREISSLLSKEPR